MKGFEVKWKQKTIVAAIEKGSLLIVLRHSNNQENDEVNLIMNGYDTSAQEFCEWPGVGLEEGDELSIEFADFDEISVPKKSNKQSQEEVLKGKIDTYHKLKEELESLGYLEK
ncbi:hypothetical protein D1013_10000 [Euzebyella marina]|uniref:Uncharacterized protein n=1 Tax=Euzebyella marina TaxID=1761453 RepID=A0A3G2L5Y0_9FLAO|nr:hypothetical protein [Euzebyella marina]AYN67677.1 hypothetical protein D1013_10000 [Euzebyella marina]